MNKRKSIFCAIIVVLSLFVFAACVTGGSGTGPTNPQTFTVMFSVAGVSGVPEPSPAIVARGSTVARPDITTPAHLQDHWRTAATGGVLWNFETNTVQNNMTLHLRRTPIVYNITYHLNGGTNHILNPEDFSVAMSLPITLHQPTRDGWIFDGWFNAVTGGAQVTQITTANLGSTVVLWARWRGIYGITYNNILSGDTNPNPTNFAEENLPLTLQNASRTRWHFDGWFSAASGGTQVTQITTAASTQVWARWTQTHALVIFNVVNGMLGIDPVTVSVGTTVARPVIDESLLSAGWEYRWFTAATGGTEWNFANAVNADMTLHMRVFRIVYNITYNGLIDGDVNDNPAAFTVADLGVNGIALKGAERDGYRFVGWFTAASGGTPVTHITAVGNTTLFARWEEDTPDPDTVEVTFDVLEYAVDVPDAVTVENGDTIAPPTLSAGPGAGWQFHWYTAETGGTRWNFATPVTEDMTLYLRRVIIIYNITYNGIIVSDINDNPATFTVEDLDIVLNDAERDGSTFVGWFTAASGGTPVTHITAVGNVILFARWEEDTPDPDTVEVTFDVLEYAVDVPDAVTVESGDTIEPPTLSAGPGAGWQFHWYTAETGGERWDFNDPVTEDMTLYLRRVAIVYTITYQLHGGENHVSNPETFTIENLPLPLYGATQGGHQFIGWFAHETEGDAHITHIIDIGDVTLHARWAPIGDDPDPEISIDKSALDIQDGVVDIDLEGEIAVIILNILGAGDIDIEDIEWVIAGDPDETIVTIEIDGDGNATITFLQSRVENFVIELWIDGQLVDSIEFNVTDSEEGEEPDDGTGD